MGFGFDLQGFRQQYDELVKAKEEALRNNDAADALRYMAQQQVSEMGALQQQYIADAQRAVNAQASQMLQNSLVFDQGMANISWGKISSGPLLGQPYHYRANWDGPKQESEVDKMIAELRHRVESFKL